MGAGVGSMGVVGVEVAMGVEVAIGTAVGVEVEIGTEVGGEVAVGTGVGGGLGSGCPHMTTVIVTLSSTMRPGSVSSVTVPLPVSQPSTTILAAGGTTACE